MVLASDLVILGVAEILFIIYAFGPQIYLISPQGIIIESIIGPEVLPSDEIMSVCVADKPLAGSGVGNGGVFSYYGIFLT